MSHVTNVKCKVRDLDALEEAAPHAGFELVRDRKTYRWYGRWVNDFRGSTAAVDTGHSPNDFGKCDHVLRLKDHREGDYEIGLVRAKDGDGWDLLYDSYGPGQRLVRAAGGENLNGIRHHYSTAKASREARAKLGPKGFHQIRQALPGGRTLIRMRRG